MVIFPLARHSWSSFLVLFLYVTNRHHIIVKKNKMYLFCKFELGMSDVCSYLISQVSHLAVSFHIQALYFKHILSIEEKDWAWLKMQQEHSLDFTN